MEGIGRNGKPCDRLNNKGIKTVQDFLFWLNVNPEKLQKEVIVLVYSLYSFDLPSVVIIFCLFVACAIVLALELIYMHTTIFTVRGHSILKKSARIYGMRNINLCDMCTDIMCW